MHREFWQLRIFVQLESESHYFFSSSCLSLAIRKAHIYALKRANERVDFYNHTSRQREELLSSVAFYLCSSFERARKRSLLLHIG